MDATTLLLVLARAFQLRVDRLDPRRGRGASSPRAKTPEVAGAIARSIYLKLSVPAFVGSFVAGAAMLVMHWKLYLVVTHWMHAKLTLALVVIALHHVIGARAKATRHGKDEGHRSDPPLWASRCSSLPRAQLSWPSRSRSDSVEPGAEIPPQFRAFLDRIAADRVGFGASSYVQRIAWARVGSIGLFVSVDREKILQAAQK